MTVLNRHRKKNFTWEHSDLLAYKEGEGTHFKSLTRQILFNGRSELPSQLRYFEIAPGGHSTLERHEHVHVVMVLRGSGRVLLGKEVVEVNPYDVMTIAPKTWHQFRATGDQAFGFLCLVTCERDKPERPSEAQLQKLKQDPKIAEFIKV